MMCHWRLSICVLHAHLAAAIEHGIAVRFTVNIVCSKGKAIYK